MTISNGIKTTCHETDNFFKKLWTIIKSLFTKKK